MDIFSMSISKSISRISLHFALCTCSAYTTEGGLDLQSVSLLFPQIRIVAATCLDLVLCTLAFLDLLKTKILLAVQLDCLHVRDCFFVGRSFFASTFESQKQRRAKLCAKFRIGLY